MYINLYVHTEIHHTYKEIQKLWHHDHCKKQKRKHGECPHVNCNLYMKPTFSRQVREFHKVLLRYFVSGISLNDHFCSCPRRRPHSGNWFIRPRSFYWCIMLSTRPSLRCTHLELVLIWNNIYFYLWCR